MTQIDYDTERVKRMVGKVLTFNGITRYERGTYDLVGGEELSDAERDQLLQRCRQCLDRVRLLGLVYPFRGRDGSVRTSALLNP